MAVYTFAVLAAAYRGKRATLAATRTHAVDMRTGEALCRTVKPDHLTESTDADYPATCPTCAKHDPRRMLHANDGPFILKSLLQLP
jgi:hypothetical protein